MNASLRPTTLRLLGVLAILSLAVAACGGWGAAERWHEKQKARFEFDGT